MSWACARLDSLLLSRCRHAAAVLGCAGTAAGARRTTTTPPLPRRCPAALPSSWWCSPPGGTPTTWASPGWRWLMQCGGRCPPTPPSSWQVGGWVLLGVAGGMGRGTTGTGQAGLEPGTLGLFYDGAALCCAQRACQLRQTSAPGLTPATLPTAPVRSRSPSQRGAAAGHGQRRAHGRQAGGRRQQRLGHAQLAGPASTRCGVGRVRVLGRDGWRGEKEGGLAYCSLLSMW